ncbi:TPA: hypothetical protein ROD88_001834 [Campylobacter coli]|nr:hypothetical protein [Campylobacter coli]
MSVAGFATYMKHINASAKLAFLANKPLGKIENNVGGKIKFPFGKIKLP